MDHDPMEGRGPAACTEAEHSITGLLAQEGSFALLLQETGSPPGPRRCKLAAALQDKGYNPFFSSHLVETGSKEGPYQDRPPLCPFRL